MGYSSLEDCVNDLERNGMLVRIKEEVDPYLEMAAIHLRVFEQGGPALLFENVKGTKFRAASNLFGTTERSRFMFRDTLKDVEALIKLKINPLEFIKKPSGLLSVIPSALHSLPRQVSSGSVLNNTTTVYELPQVVNWKDDGGAFVTLPVVYTEDPDKPGVMASNIGMYRIQLSGNEYQRNSEIGLHYQLHRGIGVHQSKWNQLGKPMKVSIFVGGPPALTFGAVMPLPESVPEVTFAGALGGRRFRYAKKDGYTIATDADFVITGDVYSNENKPEGPFGDHLGYYSLKHNFPLMHVTNVFHKNNAIWPFTVVGRPPQEDTAFGDMIHELTGSAISSEINGVKEVHAVDAAGVHPLLFAIGSERYTPYLKERRPAEILTIANHILGKGQLSLAKFLFICAQEDDRTLTTKDISGYLQHVLRRIDFRRDLHFYTNTTIDTLDYSGDGLNTGSKVVFAAAGEPVRELGSDISSFKNVETVVSCSAILPGVVAVKIAPFISYEKAEAEIEKFALQLAQQGDFNSPQTKLPLIILCDDDKFTSFNLNNFLWVTFTKSNPAKDIYGINSSTINKHWGCNGSLIIDARNKPHHAPELIKDETIERNIDRLWQKGGSLAGLK